MGVCVSIRQTHGTNGLDIIDDREQVERVRKIEKSLALDFQFTTMIVKALSCRA